MKQHSGQGFEDFLSLAAQVEGGVLVKQHPAVIFVKRGSKTVPLVTGRAWPDFCYCRNGVAYWFDAKSTQNKKRLNMPNDRRHQFEALRRLSREGFFAFYLVEWRAHGYMKVHIVNPDDEWPFAATWGDGDIDGKFPVNSSDSLTAMVNYVKTKGA